MSDLSELASLATKAALSAEWNEAVKINQKILKASQTDVEALNRLARALTCLGETTKAQKIYKKVLEIDAYNIIAHKNLEKFARSKPNGNNQKQNNNHGETADLSSLFLFEPGKTKIVSLLNVAASNVLLALNCAEKLIIRAKSHSVAIATKDDSYLGALPDDLAHKLISFMSGGNKYEAYVKSATPKSLVIFIKEVYRAPAFINQPSFLNNHSYFDLES